MIFNSEFGAKACQLIFFSILLAIGLLVSPVIAKNRFERSPELAHLITPAENQITIHKKPKIEVVFRQPIEAPSLFIMLDGVDITQIASVSPKGFSYTPIQVLMPGAHTLTISGSSAQGESFSQDIGFTTRHYHSVEMGYSENELTVTGQIPLVESDSMEDQIPDVKIEANVLSKSQIKEKGFDMSLNANAYYLEQDIEPSFPYETGANLIELLLSVNYTKGAVTTHAEMGDTNVELSNNTLPSLRRRGGQLSFSTENFSTGGFSVNSVETFGYDSNVGFGSDSQNYIHGWYGNLKLMDNRFRLRLVHSAGKETDISFGTATHEPDKKGHVSGAVLTTDFFEGKLVTEFEYDSAEFDNDTSDSTDAKNDKAYRMQIQGGVDRYSYGLNYKYAGPDYEVIGNQGLEKDREGFALNGGADFERHSVSLEYGHYRDNVENDATKPEIVTHHGKIDYAYRGFERVPISGYYQKEMAKSSDEPAGTEPTDYFTDTFFGSVAYTLNAWNVGLDGTYGRQDDQTDLNADTTYLELSLSPQYFSEGTNISPRLRFNQTYDKATDVTTDTHSLGLDVHGQMLSHKLNYNLSGAFDFITNDEDTVEQRTTTYYINLDYSIGEKIWGYISPKVSVRWESNEVEDRVIDQTTRDYAFTLVFTTLALVTF